MRRQMALRELNVQLERRVEDRTRELHAKNRLLEQEAQQRMLAQQALVQKQELLDAVLESVDVGVVACGADGALTLFNRAARDLHGMDPAGVNAAQWAAATTCSRKTASRRWREARIPLARALRGENVKDAPMVIAQEQHAEAAPAACWPAAAR
jgi:nitrogen fixation/metabolism regulation signal transduction histidine kinase